MGLAAGIAVVSLALFMGSLLLLSTFIMRFDAVIFGKSRRGKMLTRQPWEGRCETATTCFDQHPFIRRLR
jgi:hypothetical protein